MSNVAPHDIERTWLQSSRIASGIEWLVEHARAVLALAVMFQLLVLVAMMVRPMVTLATGDVLLLRVAPVDPRDLFRGDYVILSYDISRPTRDGSSDVTSATWQQLSSLAGKTIYTRLAPDSDGKHWHANGYQLEPPAEGKFIRGEVSGSGLVRYGIEQYFVEQGQGHQYEQAVGDRRLSAEIAVDRSGNAQIQGLVIE